MATVKELKATVRPQGGKGAARAERRAGRVPGVIYGNNEPPMTVSVEDKELRQKIFAGHFLTTVYDVEIDGKKHRVIPRDFHLDPVKDTPIHVDFMRIGKDSTVRVAVPLHVTGTEASPGIKRGGTVNIVTHTLTLICPVDSIPQYIEVDVAGLEIGHSRHLGEITLPKGAKTVTKEATLVTIVPPSGYAEELKAAATAAAAAATAAATPAAGAAAAPAGGAAPAAGAAAAAPAGQKK